MTLAPAVRRERRAYARQQEILTNPEKKLPRRRCMNCNKMYLKTRKNKKFCSRECQTEYGRYGSAFGPLKERLLKLIDQASKENFERRLREFVATDAGREVIKAAGFIHWSEFPEDLQTPAEITLLLRGAGVAIRDHAARITALENPKRRKARR